MTEPTDADLRAVSWDAWRGLLLGSNATEAQQHAAVSADLCEWEIRVGLERLIATPKGTRYLARLRELAAGLTRAQATFLEVLCDDRPVLSDCKDLAEMGLVSMAGDRVVWVTPLGRAVLCVRDQEAD